MRAGAIGAAFNAPLTGAFYGIELVIGTYTIGNLAPVVVASLTAVFVERGLGGGIEGFDLILPSDFPVVQFIPILALGIICALAGIGVMRGVTIAEGWFRRSPLPVWSRPMVGGFIVGTCGLVTPMVLSSGHGALRDGLGMDYPLILIATGLALKSLASAVSIGSGFRGGLFFASLFLGSLVGKIFAAILAMLSIGPVLPSVVYALIGMSAMAVAVIGGPLTMCFLALESTGSFPLTIAVLAAVIVSSLTARRTFGYSFATWRFHLRGEAIRSAVDIGWVNTLSVGRMMRRDVRTIRTTTSLETFRRDFPLGSTHRVVVVDDAGRYAGIVLTAEVFSPDVAADGCRRVAARASDGADPGDDGEDGGRDVRGVGERRAGRGRQPGDDAGHRVADRAARPAPLLRGAGPAAAGTFRRIAFRRIGSGLRNAGLTGGVPMGHHPPLFWDITRCLVSGDGGKRTYGEIEHGADQAHLHGGDGLFLCDEEEHARPDGQARVQEVRPGGAQARDLPRSQDQVA